MRRREPVLAKQSRESRHEHDVAHRLFSDLWIWMVVALGLAFLSWRGIREKARNDERDRLRYERDVAAAAVAKPAEVAPPSEPS